MFLLVSAHADIPWDHIWDLQKEVLVLGYHASTSVLFLQPALLLQGSGALASTSPNKANQPKLFSP